MTHHAPIEPDPWEEYLKLRAIADARYKIEHTCAECRRSGDRHWPYCSRATIEQKSAWARRHELRSLRTIGRMDPPRGVARDWDSS